MFTAIAKQPESTWRPLPSFSQAATSVEGAPLSGSFLPQGLFAGSLPQIPRLEDALKVLLQIPLIQNRTTSAYDNLRYWGYRGRVPMSQPVTPWSVGLPPDANVRLLPSPTGQFSWNVLDVTTPGAMRFSFFLAGVPLLSAQARLPSDFANLFTWLMTKITSRIDYSATPDLQILGYPNAQSGPTSAVIESLYIPGSWYAASPGWAGSGAKFQTGYVRFDLPAPTNITSTVTSADWLAILNSVIRFTLIPQDSKYVIDLHTTATAPRFVLYNRSRNPLTGAVTVGSAAFSYTGRAHPTFALSGGRFATSPANVVYIDADYSLMTDWTAMNTATPLLDGPSDAILSRYQVIRSFGLVLIDSSGPSSTRSLNGPGSGIIYGLLPGDEFVVVAHDSLGSPRPLAAMWTDLSDTVILTQSRGGALDPVLQEDVIPRDTLLGRPEDIITQLLAQIGHMPPAYLARGDMSGFQDPTPL